MKNTERRGPASPPEIPRLLYVEDGLIAFAVLALVIVLVGIL